MKKIIMGLILTFSISMASGKSIAIYIADLNYNYIPSNGKCALMEPEYKLIMLEKLENKTAEVNFRTEPVYGSITSISYISNGDIFKSTFSETYAGCMAYSDFRKTGKLKSPDYYNTLKDPSLRR